MSWLAGAIRRIGSRDAVSWPVFWVTLLAAIIGNLVTTNEAPVVVRAATLALGQLGLWLPLLACGYVLRRYPGRPSSALVLTSALLGLLIRALIVGTMASYFLGASEGLWAQRFVGAVFNIGLSFVVAAYVVSTFRERRRQIIDLARVEAALTAAITAVSDEYNRRNAETLATIQRVLITELNALDSDDAARSLEVLRRTASEVVRPLSHELAQDGVSRPDAFNAVDTQLSWPEVVDDAAQGRPFRPLATAGLLAVEALAATVAYPRGAAVYAAMLVTATVGLVVANAALGHVLPGRRRVARVSLVGVAAITVASAATAVVWVGLSSATPTPALALGTFVFTVTFSLGVSVASAFSRDRQRILAALNSSSLKLRRTLALVNQAQWFQQKSLSRALHGPIQTVVTAAAIRLDNAIRSGAVDAALIERVRNEILAALKGLGTLDGTVTSLEEALERLRANWAGLCDVPVSVDHGAHEILDRQPITRSCVIDICSEGVGNAIRHGSATRSAVSVTLDATLDRTIVVQVMSDVVGFQSDDRASEGEAGLGSRILDDCSLEWHLERTTTEATLFARIPTQDPGL